MEGFLEARALAEVRGEAGSTVVRVKVERGGSVHLVASKGASVAVQTVRGRPAALAALELSGGESDLADLGPGLYRFISRAPGELIVVREIELGPTTLPQTLDLRGGKEATLEILVADRAGAPIEGAEITLVTAGGFPWNTRKRTDAQGALRLTRLIEGAIEVRAQRGDAIAAGRVEVVGGGTLHLRLELRDP
ncbi:MAG: carboxypeptidase regulatory-like domain-containing protein [Planctomycetes bacterium]|nr:carboxypeptidase regulatory-like domain-containing protein [Planctomycetota bacterium]